MCTRISPGLFMWERTLCARPFAPVFKRPATPCRSAPSARPEAAIRLPWPAFATTLWFACGNAAVAHWVRSYNGPQWPSL